MLRSELLLHIKPWQREESQSWRLLSLFQDQFCVIIAKGPILISEGSKIFNCILEEHWVYVIKIILPENPTLIKRGKQGDFY